MSTIDESKMQAAALALGSSCSIPAPKLDMSELKLTQMTTAGG